MLAQLVILAIFPGLIAFAAVMDLTTMKIPNRVSLLLAVGFIVAALYAGLDATAIGLHAVTALAVLLVGFSLFSFGYLGGGDAKLLAAATLWFGWYHLLPFLLFTALFGGALSLILLAARSRPLPAGLMRVGWIARLHAPGGGAPYGIAIAAAALFVYPDTFWFATLA